MHARVVARISMLPVRVDAVKDDVECMILRELWSLRCEAFRSLQHGGHLCYGSCALPGAVGRR